VARALLGSCPAGTVPSGVWGESVRCRSLRRLRRRAVRWCDGAPRPPALLPALGYGNDGLMTRDRSPHQTAAPTLSHNRRLSDRHVNSVSVELARLNEALGAHLSLSLERGGAGGGGCEAAHERGRRPGPETAVLVAVTSNGTRRSASCPVAPATRRRRQLLALAASVAECAMDLGVGTGLYRRGRTGQAPIPDETLRKGPRRARYPSDEST
jgi:hypothetical protein